MAGISVKLQQISTEAGTCLLKSQAKALVRFGNKYIPRDAANLVPGDRVCFRKDHIQKTIDEVDIVLSGASKRYTDARELIMESNSQGIWIPRLRTHLLRGLNSVHALEPAAVAERKILFEKDDFASRQYVFIVNIVFDEIARYANGIGVRPVCWDTVANWARGEVIAPEEKRYLNALGTFNPAFTCIANDFANKGPWSQAYNLYVTMRKIAMTYLAAQNEPPVSDGPGGGTRIPGLSFGSELAALISAFSADIRSQFLDVEVLSNQELRMKRDSFRRKQRFEPHLFKGIVTPGSAASGNGSLPADIPIDAIENYSVAEITGTDTPMEHPEEEIERAKLFALEHGFSLEELKRHLLRKPDGRQNRKISEEVEKSMKEMRIYDWEQVKDKVAHEFFDKPYKELEYDEQTIVMEEGKRVIMKIREYLGAKREKIDDLLALAEKLA